MNSSASNNFRVVEGGRSVSEIMRKSRIAAKRRKTMKKIRIIILIIAIIASGSIIFFSNVVNAQEKVYEDNSVKGFMYITVSQDDTLWNIANDHIDSHYESIYQYIREVKELNGLTSDSIHSGARIIIPVYALATDVN